MLERMYLLSPQIIFGLVHHSGRECPSEESTRNCVHKWPDQGQIDVRNWHYLAFSLISSMFREGGFTGWPRPSKG